MPNKLVTNGERLFEDYLHSQGLTVFQHEKLHVGKLKRPDYSVLVGDDEFLFELKDFEFRLTKGYGAYDPFKRIRQKIVEARKKFKEYNGYCCCLVLWGNGAPLVDLTEPEVMLGSMEGNYGFSMPFDPKTGYIDSSKATHGFHEGGKMVRPHSTEPQNTRISALITLRPVRVGYTKYERQVENLAREGNHTPEEYFDAAAAFDLNEEYLGVMVWENRFASKPFPRELFAGPYDERWGADGTELKRIYAGTGILVLEEPTDS